MLKPVLLVVASKGYQPVEFENTKKALISAGILVAVASTRKGIATAKPIEGYPESTLVDYAISEIKPEMIAGIFLIGGQGALESLDTDETHRLLRLVAQESIPYGALCISPRIVARAGLLKDKRATGWNGDGKLAEIFDEHGVEYDDQSVVVDGNVITADGPSAAHLFGEAIVRVISQ